MQFFPILSYCKPCTHKTAVTRYWIDIFRLLNANNSRYRSWHILTTEFNSSLAEDQAVKNFFVLPGDGLSGRKEKVKRANRTEWDSTFFVEIKMFNFTIDCDWLKHSYWWNSTFFCLIRCYLFYRALLRFQPRPI